MAETSGNKRSLIALLLLAILATAAAPLQNTAYREARALYDRGDWSALAAFTDDALRTLPEGSDEAAKLRVLRGAANLLSKADVAAACVTPELPPRLHESDVAVIRLRVLGTLAYMD